MFGQLDQLVRRDTVFLIGVVGMGTDGTIDVRKPLGDRKQRAKPPHPRRDGDDAPDAGGRGARDDAVEVVGEIREIEMAVAVDQHYEGPLDGFLGSTGGGVSLGST